MKMMLCVILEECIFIKLKCILSFSFVIDSSHNNSGGGGGSNVGDPRQEGAKYEWTDLDGKKYTTTHKIYPWDPKSSNTCFFDALSKLFGGSAKSHHRAYTKLWRWDPVDGGVYMGQAFNYVKQKYGAILISKNEIQSYIGNEKYNIWGFVSIRNIGTNDEVTHSAIIDRYDTSTNKYVYYDPTLNKESGELINEFYGKAFLVPRRK